MSIYNSKFFKDLNKIATKMTASLNDEHYDEFKIFSDEMDTLITTYKYAHELRKWSYYVHT